MIVDRIENMEKYAALVPGIRVAAEYLRKNEVTRIEDGKYPLDGDVFVLVQSYGTKGDDEVAWESHRAYLDIQLLAEGSERCGYADVARLPVSEPYDPERDIAFYGTGSGSDAEIVLSPGLFCVFFPQDAHRPCRLHGEVQKVKKAVFKIRI